ncbi:unnamed protein product, partial [Symbiodinium sp. CCMP2456]
CARLDFPLFLHADLSGTLLLSCGKTVLSLSHPDSSIPVLGAMEMGFLLLGDTLPVLGEGDLDNSVFARSLAHCGFNPSTLDFIRFGLPTSARSYARLSDRMSVASSAYLGSTVLVISACSLGSSPSLRGASRAGSRLPALSFSDVGSLLSLRQSARAEARCSEPKTRRGELTHCSPNRIAH